MSAKQTTFNSPLFVERLQKQDQKAITEVVEAYSDHLYNAALGMGFRSEEAQDVAHSTWMTFLEVVGRFEGRSHIRTFLFGILYNKARELRRSKRKFDSYDPFDEEFDELFDGSGHWIQRPINPHKYSENDEILRVIQKCMDHLPQNQRDVFVYKLVLEEESEVICNELGLSPTNLRQLIFRGKGHMKKCIDKIFEDS